jgi:hypothetical protein
MNLHRFRVYLMEAADGGAGGGAVPAADDKSKTPANPPPPAAPAPGEEFKNMTTEQFNARLAKATEQGSKSLLKEFGFKDADEAKSFFEQAKKEADAKKTEEQRTKEKIAALEPLAAQATTLGKTIESYLTVEEGLVPEDKKALLDLAPPADDRPESKAARLDWIVKARAKGLFNATPPANAGDDKAKQPANSRAGSGNPPPPAPPPGQKHPRDMTPDEFRRYEQQRIAEHTQRRA